VKGLQFIDPFLQAGRPGPKTGCGSLPDKA